MSCQKTSLHIVFGLAWIIAFSGQALFSEEVEGVSPERDTYARYPDRYPAFVITPSAQAYTQPSEESPLALQLRQGDRLHVFGESGSFYHMEYLLQDEFPVEAWIAKPLVRVLRNPELLPEESPAIIYTPESRQEEVVTRAERLPELRDGQSVQLQRDPDQEQGPRPSPILRREQKAQPSVRLQEDRPARSQESRKWGWSTGLHLGFTRIEEKLSTQTQASTDELNFLSVKLQGFSMAAEAELTYQLNPQMRLGGRASYQLEILSSSLSSDNSNINPSGVNAQFHEMAFGPTFEYTLAVESLRSRFKPEIWLSGHVQLFNVNQLQDALRAQPVLFSHMAYFGRVLISPKWEFPLGLQLRPQGALILFYKFAESPTQEVSAGSIVERIQTGKPKTTAFALQYGGELAWKLQDHRSTGGELFVRGFYKSFPREFSDSGNRAGVRTQNAKIKSERVELGLGYRHRF